MRCDNAVSLEQIAGVAAPSPALLRDRPPPSTKCSPAQGIRQEFQDQIGSDHDLVPLLRANVGIGIMPQSAKSGDALHFIAIEDLALTRIVKVYAVAGRERSASR